MECSALIWSLPVFHPFSSDSITRIRPCAYGAVKCSSVQNGFYKVFLSVDVERAAYHRSQWLFYEETALQKESEEDSQEKKWKNMYHKDPAALWKSIGWKETTKNDEVIPPHVI